MKVRVSLAATAAATLLTLGAERSSTAQSNDKAAAVLLYDEAARLAAAHNLSEACAKYAESHRLDPQLGTLLHLGDCYEKNGQTASAWASFREATELAGNRGDAREKVARKRAAALESHVPKLLIEVPKSLSSGVGRVERDGNLVGSGAWGVAVPTDPGRHVIAASAPGRVSWSETVGVPGTGLVKVAIPELQPATDPSSVNANAPSTLGVPAGSPVQPASPPPAGTTEGQSSSGQRVAGYMLMGLGAAGAAVGAVFTARAISQSHSARQVCEGREQNCSDDEVQTHDEYNASARSARVGAILGFAAGGAALAGGLVLVLTAGGTQRTLGLAPMISASGGGGVLSGKF